MSWTTRARRTAVLATFTVALLVVGLLVAARPSVGRTAAAAPLWTERPPAVGATVVAAPPWVELAKALKPAVVNIATRATRKALDTPGMPDDETPFGDFQRQFHDPRSPRVIHGLGSGFIISPDGDIVTNNHVVDGASEIKVTMSDGREFTGTVRGRDPKTDLALVKIEAKDLHVVPLGDTAQLQVGEPVMAIGNPFGLEQTVTTGIVSATGRVIGEGPYDDFIQTDAAINPGNSGGPLISARGVAIGITTAIVSRSGGSVGVGFAIPINLAKTVLTQLAAAGHVERGWLGVTIQRLTPGLAGAFGLRDTQGALVTNVKPGSPAAHAGLASGDVIVAFNGRPVARSQDLPRAVAETGVGRDVPVTVVREGQRRTVQARIARLEDTTEGTAAVANDASKGALGLSVETVTPEVARELGLAKAQGVVVRAVREDSLASNAGVRTGDVIVSVDRQPVKTVDELKRALAAHRAGTATLFLVHRHGGSFYVPLG